ncbi:hypothetical protein OIDMADRAFT_122533 [Oidiodendron maius Zn]|uniref:Uncharacterized protein n=1 Tax=Oidiodendron maius (strain Zn) TaxID=913774 RepID=A0A0C3HCK3_OIDMZ|nr:hypothetical protein OIDMADRAFT_122533 [Oidiodendron maius Zn]
MSATKVAKAVRQLNAVVVTSGLMRKTVKVRIGVQAWDSHIQKNFNQRKHLLVHDPRGSLRTGDIVSISPGWRTSKHVKHVVNSIIAPFGEPIEARPPIPSKEELVAGKEAQKSKKAERKRLRLLEEKSAREEAKDQ